MAIKIKKILPFFLFLITLSYGQISPGDLTNAHAEFEGMSNCTLCHELGEKVTNAKCLDCHEDIQSLISKEKGYHISSEVKNKNCFQCHSEHHGRKFEMIRFDKKNFNHQLAGYNLEGKHEVIDCKKCHVSDFIEDPEIKKRKNTFLGLETSCLTCHDDYHQETLSSNDCASCHDTESFSPAPNFDHSKTAYILKGKHKKVDCKECHQLTTKNGKDFQEFNNLKFNDCKSCHEDPHNNQLQGKCAQCHTEESFSVFSGKGKFNHNTTNFTLKGSHKKNDCFSCHDKTTNPLLVFQNTKNVDENNCVECHNDMHEGKFGNECVKCHNETSFISLKSMDFFDHNTTDYPLEGMHSQVDCKQCHEGRFTKAIDFSACNNCHEDYHQNEFSVNNSSPDCNNCHTLEAGFDTSIFTFERHNNTQFPLEGAHLATPCFACHISEENERWTFKNVGVNCVECHENIHKDLIDKKYYPDNDCKTCHVSETWQAVSFDHNTTSWPLKGKHHEIKCRECHITNNEPTEIFNQKFSNLDTNCTSCHENNHGNQFEINGKTDCERCHILESWAPEKFDHNTTAFPLDGKHAEIECNQCHIASINTVDTINTSFNYKIKKFQCIDCHQ
ncbi:MAG: hypothetical protein QM495_01260 [Lutibacter sp.]|uniref:cytochrome c3 family protein n=1 Tax=Lutibacter sp. TaxID=1925666 RepID=UPI00385CAB70